MAQPGTTLADVGEMSMLRELLVDLPTSPAISVGAGDDAAVFLVNGSAVVSTDTLVEGNHFRRDWSTATDIGRKAVAVSVSDLEAMGAVPVTMVVAMSAPASLEISWVRDFLQGVLEEAERADISLVGGDTTRSRDPVSYTHLTLPTTPYV